MKEAGLGPKGSPPVQVTRRRRVIAKVMEAGLSPKGAPPVQVTRRRDLEKVKEAGLGPKVSHIC